MVPPRHEINMHKSYPALLRLLPHLAGPLCPSKPGVPCVPGPGTSWHVWAAVQRHARVLPLPLTRSWLEVADGPTPSPQLDPSHNNEIYPIPPAGPDVGRKSCERQREGTPRLLVTQPRPAGGYPGCLGLVLPPSKRVGTCSRPSTPQTNSGFRRLFGGWRAAGPFCAEPNQKRRQGKRRSS